MSRRTPEQRLASVASRQHGIVTRHEALAEGLTGRQVDRRIRNGSLIRVYPGVFRLGHCAPSRAAGYMAAVKACGEGAVLAGLSAAHHLRITRSASRRIEVTAPTERRVEGLLVHRARRAEVERTLYASVPVTTPARTLLDVASRLDDDRLGRACHEAFVHHSCALVEVEAVLARRRNFPGQRRLLALLGGDDPIVLSRMERRFLDVLRADGLEPPATNVRVGTHLVDCRWPDLHLTVELDSYRFHGSRRAWERDRRRDREARQRGDELIRYTSEDVFVHTRAMLIELRERIPRAGRRRRRRGRSP